MTIYNRYIEVTTTSLASSNADLISSACTPKEVVGMTWEALFRPTWVTGYMLSEFTFTADPQNRVPVHPLGTKEWTAEDADISDAVLVSLSASSKTGRGFAYHVLRRGEDAGPKGFLQVTQSPGLVEIGDKVKSVIPNKAARYDELKGCVEWMAGLKPSGVVIVDFGARAGCLDEFLSIIESHQALSSLKRTIVQVGSEQKVGHHNHRNHNLHTDETGLHRRRQKSHPRSNDQTRQTTIQQLSRPGHRDREGRREQLLRPGTGNLA